MKACKVVPTIEDQRFNKTPLNTSILPVEWLEINGDPSSVVRINAAFVS